MAENSFAVMPERSTSEIFVELAEFAIVYASETISDGTMIVPKGAVGTIVGLHDEDGAYEVEFEPPHQAVVSVQRRQIRAE